MAISPYVARLRQRIGTELLLLPTVAVLPVDDQGRLLLVRITDNGRWATVGGSIEPDEHPEDAARREAQEEAGVDVELGRLIGALGGPEYRITYANGDRISFVSLVYEATVTGGTPRPDHDETEEVGWFPLDAVLDLDLTDVNRHLLTATLPILSARTSPNWRT